MILHVGAPTGCRSGGCSGAALCRVPDAYAWLNKDLLRAHCRHRKLFPSPVYLCTHLVMLVEDRFEVEHLGLAVRCVGVGKEMGVWGRAGRSVKRPCTPKPCALGLRGHAGASRPCTLQSREGSTPPAPHPPRVPSARMSRLLLLTYILSHHICASLYGTHAVVDLAPAGGCPVRLAFSALDLPRLRYVNIRPTQYYGR